MAANFRPKTVEERSGGGEPAHAPALTIEGGADFADDEPNFNRDAPVAGGGPSDRGPERSGDRGPDRGGDRGGDRDVVLAAEAVVLVAIRARLREHPAVLGDA